MRISSVTICGFRCFGPSPTTVNLDDLTTIIGSNGSGKSTLLLALCRMFGTSSSARSLRFEDFHLPNGKSREEFSTLSLFIEVRIDLPELSGTAVGGTTVPECFNQMIVDGRGESPYCRIRLEATWTRSNTEEGDIEESIFWIKTPDEKVADDKRRDLRAAERSRIHVLYVPAIREPGKQIQQASGSVMGRLLKAIKWSDEIGKSVEAASSAIVKAFRVEAGVKAIESGLQKSWQDLQEFAHLNTVQLHPLQTRFQELLRQLQIQFGPNADSVVLSIDTLSEGQKSLFYFALLVASFELESTAGCVDSPFSADVVEPPSLTLFAVEEPENHLAPHYLRRICDAFLKLSTQPTVQVLLTSHSPAILSRVDPANVRHIRSGDATVGRIINQIKLPKEKDDAYKYVKEAVRAYPELYFSKLVILGEGDSEEIVLQRLAESFGIHADRSFVAIVPLGGRYVNHFWRLLSDLAIPFITLLDLDRERSGGGWGRIKYACIQLTEVGIHREKLFTIADGHEKTRVLSNEDIEKIHEWNVNELVSMVGWIQMLENFDVFFSEPLDLDFSMLSAFRIPYQKTGARGPQIPKKEAVDYEEKYAVKLAAAQTATLKPDNSGGLTYTAEQKELFVWYSYLFLGNGKPTTHILALADITDGELRAKCPPVLSRLVNRIQAKLKAVAE